MPASSTAIPSPFPLSPTDQWDGVDGNWSTFRISIGTPNPQSFRVLISTRGSAPWVPAPEACVNVRAERRDCATLRGVEPFLNSPSPGFRNDESKSWTNLNTYALDLEKNLGWTGTGHFGYDTVHLGHDGSSGTSTLNKTLVAEIVDSDNYYYLGLLGLGDTKGALAGSPDVESFITDLKEAGKIPSSSYGYTAGAMYRYKGVPGSLVLGGYDQSRFVPTALNFTYTPNDIQPLKVGIQSITTNASLVSHVETDLLPGGKPGPWAYIDSTVPYLRLPKEVCDKFQAAFGLEYIAESKIYKVNETLYDKVVELNPALTFQLGNNPLVSGNNTPITLPYAAFDLWLTSVNIEGAAMRYFPLHRAANESQNTIGRVFLQEAYLTVDHERGQFRISQANFSETMPPSDIRPIYSPGTVFPSKHHHGLSAAAKAGISIAAVLAFLLMVAAILFRCWLKPRRAEKEKDIIRRRGASIGATSMAPTYQEKYDQQPPGYTPAAIHRNSSINNKTVDSWVEMPAQQVERRPELDGTHSLSYELAATHDPPSPVHEMEGNAGAEGSAAGEARTADGDGSGSGERTGVKKRGRRASVVPFFS